MFVPIVDRWLPLGWGWYVLVFFIIAGAANAVNLTDGLDGLAAGTSIIALFTLTAMAVTIYIRSRRPNGHRIENRLDAAFIGAAVIGAAIGFLWFNAFPAEVFMGDTGAMALGGAIAAMAIFLKVELLLLLVGGIFVIEALSVMLQVVSFKYWGRRVFLMAPIHHHFEMKAWSETKIMVRFWIVTGILCAAGFALFYKYYPQIRPPPIKANEGARLRPRALGHRGRASGCASAATRSSWSTGRSATRTSSALLDGVDLVVKSPGRARRGAARARRRGSAAIPVWSELELGWRLLAPTGTRFVGVTGTNGKSTTCELLGAIFRAAGRDVVVAGNIGTPLTSIRAARLGGRARYRRSSSRTCTSSPATWRCCSTSSRITSTATGRSRPTAPRSCGSSSARASRSCRAGPGSPGSSSRPTTRCRPSR